jgi:tetratricopeptide (TPR) repeat protein
LYWEGRYYQLKLAPRFVDIAIEKYQKAIDLDQNFALAWTGISDSHRGLILSGEKSPAEESKLAVEAANKALAIDPQLAEAHLARALAYFWLEHDWSRAEAEFKRSLELDPKSAVTRANYAHMLSNMGRHDQAISEIRTAREQDSYSANWLTYDGIVHLQAGQLDAAFARFEDAKRMDRELWLPHFFEAQAYTDLQRSDEALASARKATDINDSQSISTAYECVALARLDRRDEAEKVFDELLRRNSERYVPPYHLAIAYMGLDKREEAVRWLEKSYVEGDVKIVFLKADRIWDPIRSETRFVELITKLNLPQ